MWLRWRFLAPYLFLAAFYFAVMSLTVADAPADSSVYAGEVARYLDGQPGAGRTMWEFGHLLWRPVGAVLWRAGSAFMGDSFEGSRFHQVYWVYYLTVLAFGLSVPMLVYRLARVAGSGVVRGLSIAAAFLLAHPVLNFCQTGTSYIPGLAFQLLALTLLVEAPVRRAGQGIRLFAAGAALAVSVLLWFPYAVTAPAVFVASLCWQRKTLRLRDSEIRRRLRLAAPALAAFVACTAAAYAGAMAARGIGTASEAVSWVADSPHGMKQDRTLIRLATGLPRGLVHLGNDGMLLKRFLLKDPYAPVGAADLFRLSLWKLAAVYAALAGLAFALWRRSEWGMLATVTAMAVPMLAFAVAHEPSSTERFLPALPVLFLAVVPATSWFRLRAPEQAVIAGFGIAMAIANLGALGAAGQGDYERELSRIRALERAARPGSAAVLLSFRDGLYGFSGRFPFDERSRSRVLKLALTEPSNISMARWRESFAARVLRHWGEGSEVWISTRMLAERPRPEWSWVEGEDRNLRWRDVHGFFGMLEADARTGGDDGFARLADTEPNRVALGRWASKASPPGS